MSENEEELFDIFRNLGITPYQLQKRYPDYGGGTNWDAVEKDKRFLKLLFPDVRDQITELNESLEKANAKIFNLEEKLESLESDFSKLKGFSLSLYEVRGQATTAQNMSFISITSIVLVLALYIYDAYF